GRQLRAGIGYLRGRRLFAGRAEKRFACRRASRATRRMFARCRWRRSLPVVLTPRTPVATSTARDGLRVRISRPLSAAVLAALPPARPDEPRGKGEAAECESDRGEQHPPTEVRMLALPTRRAQARPALPNDAGEVHGEHQPAGQRGYPQVVQWRDARRPEPG